MDHIEILRRIYKGEKVQLERDGKQYIIKLYTGKEEGTVLSSVKELKKFIQGG